MKSVFIPTPKQVKFNRFENNSTIIQGNSELFQAISQIRVELCGKFNVMLFRSCWISQKKNMNATQQVGICFQSIFLYCALFYNCTSVVGWIHLSLNSIAMTQPSLSPNTLLTPMTITSYIHSRYFHFQESIRLSSHCLFRSIKRCEVESKFHKS